MPNKIKLKNTKRITPEMERIMALEEALRAANHNLTEQKRATRHWMDTSLRRANELDTAFAIREGADTMKLKARVRAKSKSESAAVVVFSDWHVEENVDPSTINGKNEYNLDIADERIARVVKKTLRMVDIWRSQTKVDQLVVALLGDFITGYIHEELEESNNLSPTEAVLWVQKRLLSALEMLLEEGKFKKIYVPCSIGNHGRSTKKPRISTAHRNSFEWLMYHNMQQVMARYSNKIEFQISNSYHNYMEVFGRTLRFHHGDWFNYREGIGGISVPVNKGILRWNKTKQAWLDIFGHWHQFKDHGAWMSNSSLIGYAPFALKIKAQYEPPSQTLLFIEKDHGKTGSMQMWADRERM